MQALVIDDSRVANALMGRMLAQLGFDIVEAEHGLDGPGQLAAQAPIDLVQLDSNDALQRKLELLGMVIS